MFESRESSTEYFRTGVKEMKEKLDSSVCFTVKKRLLLITNKKGGKRIVALVNVEITIHLLKTL